MNLDNIALNFIKGKGIEIGAFANPKKVNANVTYIDRCTGEERFREFPHLTEGTNFVKVDIIDDAETLESIESNSQDFVITSHVIDHLNDPVNALYTWDRVLKLNGIIYLTIPDMRYTFDKDQKETTYEDLFTESYYDNPETHKYFWTQTRMVELINRVLPNYDIEFMFKGEIDSTFVLRKVALS